MKDPLAGKRTAINNRDISVLIWPAVDDQGRSLPCPVAKGDRFKIRSVEIEIENPTRKLPKGRKAEWHATFVRHERDRPQLLRRVPSGIPDGPDHVAGRSEQERARVESAYTSSPRQALVDEPESVGPDWKDHGVAEREKRRQDDRREVLDQEAEVMKAAARLKQVGKEQARKGKDLTPLLADIYARLAAETKEAA